MHALALLAAAASWSAPQTVSAPHTFAGPLYASADRHGGVLAAWDWQDGVGQKAPSGASKVRVVDGVVSPERRAPDGLVAAIAYGDGRSLELASKQVDTRGQRWRLTVHDAGATTLLATAFILFRPQLAVAPDGTAIATWVELHGRRQIVRAATRLGTGRFSRPFTLSGRGQTTVLSAAVAPRHDMLVAFVRNGRLLARVRRPGRPWGPIRRLAGARVKTQWQLTPAFDARNRAVLVWRRHRFTRPGQPGVRALESATLGRGAARWSPVRSIERDGAAGASLTAIPGGLALGYAFGPNSHATARVRLSGAAGRFGAARDAAQPQGGLRSVTVAYDGVTGLVAGWVIPNPSGDGGGIGYAAVAPPGSSAFGPREQVTPNEATFELRVIDGRAGVRAFWTARPEGTGPSVALAQIHTVVRTATRVRRAP